MIEPITSLVYSVASNKGIYALLLGSGISRAAEVPTGWDITLELIRRLARIQNEDYGSDPAAWYRQKYEEDADYSKLLDQIAKTPSESSNILTLSLLITTIISILIVPVVWLGQQPLVHLFSRDYVSDVIHNQMIEERPLMQH